MNKKKLGISIGAGVLAGIILASGVGLAKISAHGKFPSGTHISSIDVSGKTPIEAEEVLREEKDRYMKSEIQIKMGEETKTFSPEELGIKILVPETITTIKEVDAKGWGLINILGNATSRKTNYEPVVAIKFEVLEKTMEERFAISEKAPKNATFAFDSGNRLQIEEGEKGIIVDKEKIAKDLREGAKKMEPTKIKVETTEENPEITKEDLEKQKENLERALNQRTTLIDPVYRDNWYIRLRDNIDWVEFEPKEKNNIPFLNNSEDEEKHEIRITIKQEKIDEYVDAHISRWLDREAEDVKIYKNEEGKVIIEGSGSDGKEVDRRMLKNALELAVETGITEITVPVLKIEPTIEIDQELKDLGIKERIGTGHSSYYGSPWNRVHNIKVSAERFNGTLIPPGEVFSFNTALGPVNAATGYRPELVIKPEGTIPEYGGGICQTSTTMYRAAILSGLPIVERHPHSYAVTYYSQAMGHGMDATIYRGGPDLRFKNDTEGHILIQGYVKDNYELYFVFYGTDDGRTVEMEGPFLGNYRNPGPTIYEETTTLAPGETKQMENRHVGFRADWKRTITWPDGKVIEEDILTNYRAIPARILVGAGEKEEE